MCLKCTLASQIIAILPWLIIQILEVKGYNNVTNKYMLLEEEQLMKGRFLGYNKPRFLTFQTDDDDISIEMQLSVPFLKIPVKKTMDSATGLMEKFRPANVNLAAVALAGMLIFASSFILPSVLKLFSFDHVNGGIFGRAEDGDAAWLQNMGSKIEKILDSKGVPPVECFGRIVCGLVRKSVDAHENGGQNSSDKIIDGLASNEWILEILKDTAYAEAISDGYNGENCSAKYSRCKINQNALHTFAKSLSSKMKNI